MGWSKPAQKYIFGYLVVQPVVFLFLSIFVFRDDVKYLYLLSGVMLAVLAAASSKLKLEHLQKVGLVLTALSSIGLSASVILTLEKFELLQNPDHVTSCSLSPVVSCSPVIGSPQASAFDGIPNPVFGIFGFACVLTAGMTILAGARKLSRYWWQTLLAVVAFAVGFCIWLINAGVYDIGALCLYCMVVWLVTFTLFWVVLSESLQQKAIRLPATAAEFVTKNRDTLIAVSIAAVVVLLYFRWADYWNSLF